MGLLVEAAQGVENWFSQEEEYERMGFDNYAEYWQYLKPEREEYQSQEEYEKDYDEWFAKKPLSGSWFGGY